MVKQDKKILWYFKTSEKWCEPRYLQGRDGAHNFNAIKIDYDYWYGNQLKMFPGSIFPSNEKHHFGIISLIVLFLLGLEETQGCAVVECICHRGEIDCMNLGYRSVPFFNSDGRIYDTLDLSKNRLRRIRGHAFKNLTVKGSKSGIIWGSWSWTRKLSKGWKTYWKFWS